MNLRTLSILVLALLAAQASGLATDFQIEKIVDEAMTKAKAETETEEAVLPVPVPKRELSDSQTDALNPSPTPPQKAETTDHEHATHERINR